MKYARRYRCRWYGEPGTVHLAGYGKRPRKTCGGCGGELLVEEGLWGVFVFDITGRAYSVEDALKVRLSRKVAWALANKLTMNNPDMPGGYVVHWLPKEWLT